MESYSVWYFVWLGLDLSLPLSNSRGQRSSLPQTRRGLTLLSQLCRDTTIRVRIGEEDWGSWLHSRWGPLPLHQKQWRPERPLPNPQYRDFSEAPLEAPWGHWHKSREPRVSWSNPRKTWRVLFQRLLMPDSPTMTPEQGRAPLATSRKTDFPSTTQEAPWVPHHTSWENPQWRRSSRKTTRCPRQGEMGAFFSCLTWRALLCFQIL